MADGVSLYTLGIPVSDFFLILIIKIISHFQDGDHSCIVKKFCPHLLIDTKNKANVTCAVYNWNGSGKHYKQNIKQTTVKLKQKSLLLYCNSCVFVYLIYRGARHL